MKIGRLNLDVDPENVRRHAMKIAFDAEQKAWIRKVTPIDPEADMTDDDLFALIEALSDDLQRNGLTDDDENERGWRDAELLTWLARNT